MKRSYSKEEHLNIIFDIERWNGECQKISEYGNLSISDKEEFEFITEIFANCMYEHHIQSPKQWTATALEDILTNHFVNGLHIERSVYDSVEPVLDVFFKHLDDINILKNYKALSSRLRTASKKMLKSVDNLKTEAGDNQIISLFGTNEENFLMNHHCPCGSGKKYRDCCGSTESDGQLPQNVISLMNKNDKSDSPQAIAEPTLEQWAALYDAAKNIQKLKPWSELMDSDLIVIRLSEMDEPLYCSVMGNAGECYGVAVYIGNEGLLSYYRLASSYMDESLFTTGLDQYCFICYFGDREEISPKEHKILKQLGIRFRGRNNWIYFRALEPGYYPWFLDSEQAEILTKALENLAIAYTNYRNGDINVDFDDDEVIFRYHSSEKNVWIDTFAEKPPVIETKAELVINDTNLFASLKKKKFNNCCLEFEVAYLPFPIQENENERPYLPRIILFVDKSQGIPVAQSIIDKKVRIEMDVIDMLSDYIQKYGKPKSINIRDNNSGRYISNFCRKLDINLIDSQGVPTIDRMLLEVVDLMDDDMF